MIVYCRTSHAAVGDCGLTRSGTALIVVIRTVVIVVIFRIIGMLVIMIIKKIYYLE